MVKVEPMIRIAGVSKTFSVKDNKVEALKNVSLDIAKGDIYGIIGMSGAGKSTLVRCLNFLERPTEGTVYVEGQDLSTLDAKQLRQLRKHVAMIFQNFNLLMQRTVLDNVCFPMEIAGVDKKTAREKAREFLKVVELSDKEKAYPAQLSGGQKQRVAIARALAMNPTILLCDEATSALDPTTTKSILALLKDINEKYGITIVIITHSMEVVQEICTHVAIIDAGELAENGTVADVFASPKSRAAKKLVFQGDQKVGDYEEPPLHPHRIYEELFFRTCDCEHGSGMQGERQYSDGGYPGHRRNCNWSDDSAASGGKSDRRQDDCVSERKKSYSRGVEGLC